MADTVRTSSLLLSPEAHMSAYPTGAALISAARKGARARMMGVRAVRREFGLGNESPGKAGNDQGLAAAFEEASSAMGVGRGIGGSRRPSLTGVNVFRTPSRTPVRTPVRHRAPPPTSPSAGLSPTQQGSTFRTPRRKAACPRHATEHEDPPVFVARARMATSPTKGFTTPASRPRPLEDFISQRPPSFPALQQSPLKGPSQPETSLMLASSPTSIFAVPALPVETAPAPTVPQTPRPALAGLGAMRTPASSAKRVSFAAPVSTPFVDPFASPSTPSDADEVARASSPGGFYGGSPSRSPLAGKRKHTSTGTGAAKKARTELSPKRTRTPTKFFDGQTFDVSPTSRRPAARAMTIKEDDAAPRPQARLLFPDAAAAGDSDHSDLEIQAPSPTKAGKSPSKDNMKALLFPSASTTPTKRPTQTIAETGTAMPATHATLISLHSALERALLLHFATEGGGASIGSALAASFDTTPSEASTGRPTTPEPDDGVRTVRLPNLVAWPVIRPIVERGSGRRFGEEELAQLLWLWSEGEDQQGREKGGMGFLVSHHVTVDPFTRRRVNTLGIGLVLTVRANVQRNKWSLASPGAGRKGKGAFDDEDSTMVAAAQGSPAANAGKRDAMSLMALWSSKADERKDEIARRLNAFAESQGVGASSPSKRTRFVDDRASKATVLPPVPRAELPTAKSGRAKPKELPPKVVVSREGSPTPTPRASAARTLLLGGAKAKEPASASGRASSLMERIKAKEAARGAPSPAFESRPGGRKVAAHRSEKAGEMRRKAMLSRLPDVCDGIFMMFADGQGGTASPTRQKKAASMSDVSRMIAQSSKISLSEGEAVDAVRMLAELCPAFISTRIVAGADWVVMQSSTPSVARSALADVKERIKEELAI